MSQNYTFKPSFNIESIRYSGYIMTSSGFTGLDICRGTRAFIHIVRGYVAVKAEDSEYMNILQPGDTLFLTPTRTYNVRNYVDSSLPGQQTGFIFMICFECRDTIMEHFNDRLCNTHQEERHFLSMLSSEIEKTFDFSSEQMVRLKKDAPFSGDQVIRNYLELFLISCYRRGDLADISDRTAPGNISPRNEELCGRIISYIREHLSEKIVLNDIAAALNLSVAFIERSFNEYTGSPVVAYISKLRIEEAKLLISNNKYSFTEIAEKVGFDNVHYFSARFRKYSGMTPTEYARSLLSGITEKKKYTIVYSKGEPDWDTVPVLKLEDLHWETVHDVETEYRIAWNEEGIMLYSHSTESHPTVRYERPNSPVYLDSYTEFFLQPYTSQPRYFNIGVNPNGAIYCGIGEVGHDRVRLLTDTEDESDNYKVRIVRTSKGWDAYWTVGIDLLQLFFSGYTLEAGNIFYGNCCKCNTNGFSSHHLSWAYLPARSRSFHRPEFFGIMMLGQKNDTESEVDTTK